MVLSRNIKKIYIEYINYIAFSEFKTEIRPFLELTKKIKMYVSNPILTGNIQITNPFLRVNIGRKSYTI